MKTNNTRDEQQKMIEEAKAYFDKLGLTHRVESFIYSEPVNNILHAKYERFKAEAKKIVSNLPGPARKRGNEFFDQITQHEDDYFEDVKNSFICTVTARIQAVNDLVGIDDVIADKLYHAFKCEAESNLVRVVSEIANGLKEIMLVKFEYTVNIPAGIPYEVAQFLFAISGGKPLVSLEEIENYRKVTPSYDGESGE